MKIQTYLRQQGIQGHPYKLMYGTIKDNISSLMQAQSKPINLIHQISPRFIPFIYETVKEYSMDSLSFA